MISVSIVSHGQFKLIKNLLEDLNKYCKDNIEVILTINIPEEIPENFEYNYPIKLIINSRPKGFGANHNAAFSQSQYDYFCVLNPDIRLLNNVFDTLCEDLKDTKIGVVGPAIIDEAGLLQDSARKFPTLIDLFKRVFLKKRELSKQYDWIGGMFMLFRREVYEEIQGFDERYYLYCEDMDLCKRLLINKYKILYDEKVRVIHESQRDSHKKFKHLIWHLKSYCRYFFKYG